MEKRIIKKEINDHIATYYYCDIKVLFDNKRGL